MIIDCILCKSLDNKSKLIDMASFFDVDYKILLSVCEKCDDNLSKNDLIDKLNDGLKDKSLDLYVDYEKEEFTIVNSTN